jgi:glycosyltransferase involved in cell wall biosynthesis
MKDVLKSKIVKLFALPIMNFVERTSFSNATHINLISAGFKGYFARYPKPNYSFYTNGIDDEFIELPKSEPRESDVKRIVYAGNIGEGQGLHTIIPLLAKNLGPEFEFWIIGDGGAKSILQEELKRLQVSNVYLKKPVKRNELKAIYADCDFFLMHLNNYEAFKKVLPSKIFELGAYDKPIIAGVGGYANDFIKQYVSNTILFEPGNLQTCVKLLKEYEYRLEMRNDFINKFNRTNLNREMASSILKYLK